MDRADTVFTMGCAIDESCPVMVTDAEDWGLEDPAGQSLEVVRGIRDEIEGRVRELVLQARGQDYDKLTGNRKRRALERTRQKMSEQGTVVALHISEEHFGEMQSIPSAEVLHDLGVSGDRYAIKRGHNRSNRQVLMMDKETLDELSLPPGTVRENITVQGMSIYGLASGTRVAIGSHVVLEVTEPCEPCERMDAIRPGLREQLEGRRGMLTKVIKGGGISVGDAVKATEPVPN